MKKVTQKELDRLSRKKGHRVKRKMGAQKRPEPVATESDALSGAEPPEQPVPVSLPEPQNITVDMQPFAAMSASIAASNRNLEKLIERNTEAIEAFRDKLIEEKPIRSVAYRHTIKRDSNKFIEEVISTPMGKQE